MARTKRQIRELEDQREDQIRELGSMALEMHNRKRFDLDVLRTYAGEVQETVEQIDELDAPDR